MIIQAVRSVGGLIPGARWEVESQNFYVGQEYLMVMQLGSVDRRDVERVLSKDISLVGPDSVGLMFHVARIRCVHDVASKIWENVVFVEANQPRVEAWFQTLLPYQDSSSGTMGD